MQGRAVQARVPEEIQEMAKKVIKASGLSVSDVIRVLMTRIAQDRAIPAEIFQPNAATVAAFAEVERGAMKQFASVDALFDELNSDD